MVIAGLPPPQAYDISHHMTLSVSIWIPPHEVCHKSNHKVVDFFPNISVTVVLSCRQVTDVGHGFC